MLQNWCLSTFADFACILRLQYNYGQQAADAEYKRNPQMWKDTNFGAQRAEMEDAGLSVGLMYGNGGGQAASTAGGNATPACLGV